ncbi:hypothetical protein GCM10028820_17900 [Tessaracoccus terricola]
MDTQTANAGLDAAGGQDMAELVDTRQPQGLEALERVTDSVAMIRLGEVQKAIALADLAEVYSVEVDTLVPELAERMIHPGHEGTPAVSEFLGLEIGAALGISQQAAFSLVAEVLDLKHRHPELWRVFCVGGIERWEASKLVDITADLSAEQVREVDAKIARRAGQVSFNHLRRLTHGWVAQADPELARERERTARSGRLVHLGPSVFGTSEMVARLEARDAKLLDDTLNRLACAMAEAGDERDRNQRRAAALGLLADPSAALDMLGGDADATARSRGRTVVHVHLAAGTVVDPDTGVARIEGFGPLTVASLPEFLAGSHVTVRPVLDDADVEPVDSYEIPDRIRDAVHRRNPTEMFPYSGRCSRSLDLDHVEPYAWEGARRQAQTRIENLIPLSRRVHRAKTLTAWQVVRTAHGKFVWHSPLGRRYTVLPDGTTRSELEGSFRV